MNDLLEWMTATEAVAWIMFRDEGFATCMRSEGGYGLATASLKKQRADRVEPLLSMGAAHRELAIQCEADRVQASARKPASSQILRGDRVRIPDSAWSDLEVVNGGNEIQVQSKPGCSNALWFEPWFKRADLLVSFPKPAPMEEPAAVEANGPALSLTAADETKAEALIAGILRSNENLRKIDAQNALVEANIQVSETGFKQRIWPRARVAAGKSKKAKPGRKPTDR